MKEGYWFRSTRFRIEAMEADDVNPDIYGRQLAQWLKSQLESHGQPVLDVIPEDFGWCVLCQVKPFSLWIGCGNMAEVALRPGSQGNKNVVWHCFPVAEASLFARLFKRIDIEPALGRLDDLLREILITEPTIQLVDDP